MTAEFSILLKATIALAAGLVVVSLARRARASVRHLVLAATLAVLMILPMGAALLPDMTVVVPVPAPAPSTTPAPAAGTVGAVASAAAALVFPQPAAQPAPDADVRTASMSLGDALRLVWAFGAALLLAVLAHALWKVQRIRRTGIPWLTGQALVDRLAHQSSLPAGVMVMLHEDVPAPVTCGWRSPAIVLPEDARSWTEADLERTFVHELEHVRRSDWIMQLTARVICAAYWFHPLVWIVWRRLCLECERACDDAVVNQMEQTDYAEQLVTLAERLNQRDAQPVLSMARRSDLSVRVRAVLDRTQLRGRAGAATVASACALAAIFSLVVAPMRVEAARDAGAAGELATAAGDFTTAVGDLTTAAGDMVSAAGDLVSAGDAPGASDTNTDTDTDSTTDSTSDGGGQRGDSFDRTKRAFSDAVGKALVEAAADGDIEEVGALLQAGVDVNSAVRGDGTALLVAAREGHEELVSFLLQRGADANVGVPGDGNALTMAAREGHRRIVQALLDRGADINLGVEGDGNALIMAAREGHEQIVRLLLDRGASIEEVVDGDENALISAAGSGQLPVVRLLVARGANINARVWADNGGDDRQGEWRTPLNMARRGGYDEVVRYLQSAGAVE